MTIELKKDKVSGRYYLNESSEFNVKPIVSQDLKESLKVSNGKAGTLIVRNIPCTILNRENMNGRIYSTQILEEAIQNAKRLNKFADKMLLSKPDEHPSSSFIPPSKASHAVINCYIKKNIPIVVDGKKERHDVLFEDWEIFNTQNGKDLRALVEAGVSFGVSIRGLGDLEGKYVKSYDILGTDCVGNPSSSTFSGMPVLEAVVESVENPVADPNLLNENFKVSSSSTTVVRDLEQAVNMQREIDAIGYGTVAQTSTKMDQEIDAKTGATTKIVTLEAETEDEVSDLDQALALVKRAMLNGKVSIDSVTIENIKEEEPKESTENSDTPVLKEEEKDEDDVNDTERYGVCGLCGDKLPLSDLKKEKDFGYLCNHCAKGLESREGKLDFEDEYIPESKMVNECGMKEATEDKAEDPNEGKKFVIKAPAGFVAMDGNALVFKEDPKEALHFIKGKENTGLVHLSEVEKILDTMGVYDVEKYFKKDTTDISVPEEGNGIKADNNAETEYGGSVEILDVNKEESVMTEDNGSNTRFSAEVAYDKGNGNLETNTVPVSGVELDSILAEVGNLYDMKSQKATGPVSIKVTDTQTGEVFNYNKENNSLDPVQSADTNMVDVQTEPQLETPVQEANGEIEQNKNELKVDLDKNHSVTKKFDTTAQASIAKAGIEQGKLNGDVMLSEDDLSEGIGGAVLGGLAGTAIGHPIIGAATGSLLQDKWKSGVPKDKWKAGAVLGGAAGSLVGAPVMGAIAGGALQNAWTKNKSESLEEDTPNYQDAPDYGEENFESGWYVMSPEKDIVGPYNSKEEAMSGLEQYGDLVKAFYISPDDELIMDQEIGLAAESSNMNEVLYSNPGEASDDYVEVPLKDDKNEDMVIELNNIDWDIDSVVEKLYNGDSIDIDELPNEMTVVLSSDDYEKALNVEELMQLIFDKAREQIGIKVNNADLNRIN